MPIRLFFFLCLSLTLLKSQVTSNSFITISSPAPRTIALPFMNYSADKGNWYVTPTDAHAAFFLADAPTSKVRLSLTLNGKQNTFVINHDNNQDTGRKTDLGFELLLDGNLYSLDRSDSVTVNVTHIDPLSLEATFSGTLSHLQIKGVISLHRASAPIEKSAGNYIDCDPIIHDWLNQAEARAPSDCEVKFDQYARAAFAKAFAPMLSSFQNSNWRLSKNLNTAELTSVARGSEKTPYQFGFAPGGDMTIQLATATTAAPTTDPGMAKVMELIKQGKYAEAEAADKARKAQPSASDNAHLSLRPSLNTLSKSIVNFQGSPQASPLAGGGGIVLFVPAAQPNTGGAEGEPTTYVLLGPWSAPTGSTDISVKAAPSPAAPRLSAQTIVVELRCSREVAQKAIQSIDWSSLRALMTNH